MNNDRNNFLLDLEKDFKKLNQDLKKKYTKIHESIDKCLNLINILKKQEEEKKIEEVNCLFEPIKLLIKSKKTKYILQCLIIIKKIIELKILNKNDYCDLLNLLKNIVEDLNSEENILKIIEIIQSLLLSSEFSATFDDISIILKICLFLFNSKNSTFKTSSKYIFKTLTDNITQNSEEEIFIQYIKFLMTLFDEKNIYTKCLGIELIIQILNNITIDSISENFKNLIEKELSPIILNMFSDNNQYILALKLCRLSIILLLKYQTGVDFIRIFMNYSFSSKIIWQKQIGLESLCSILKNSELIWMLFQYKKDCLKEIFDKLKDLTYNIEDKKDINKNKLGNKRKMSIENDLIILDSDEVSSHNNENIDYIKKLILECFNNIQKSFVNIMKEKDISINQLNFNLSPEQFNIRNMLNFDYEPLRDSVFYILIKTNNDFITFKVLYIIKTLMGLYSSICLPIIRDDYLERLCNELSNTKDFNKKKILIIHTLIIFLQNINLLEVNSLIYLLDTFEHIYKKIKSYKTTFNISKIDLLINDIIQKNEENNKNQKIPDTELNYEFGLFENSNNNDYINNITLEQVYNFIDNLFIDSSSYNNEVISNIIEAITNLINKALEKKKELKILFFINKLIIISVSNIKKAEIIYIKVMNILTNIYYKDIPEVNLYCLDIIAILINKFLQYYKIKNNLDSNFSEDWSEETWQRTIFSPYLEIANQPITKEKVDKIIENIQKIIQISGEYMDTFGWASFIEICSSLLNTNSEKTFNLVKQTLNDYKVYFSPFNIIPMLSLLGTFAIYDKDRNNCFNAIELFWSCADITENFQCGKIKLTNIQKKIFENLEKNHQSPELLFQEIWRQIFFKLTNINSDSRGDVRKSGINVFTDIFVTKYQNITSNYRKIIINEIFFKVFITNFKLFKDMLLTKSEIDSECEENALNSLLSIVKIVKVFINDDDESLEQKNQIFNLLIDNIIEIIPNLNPEFLIEILKCILDIQLKDSSYFILQDISLYWKYMNEISKYLKSELFQKKYILAVTTGRIIESILNNLKIIFLSNNDLTNEELMKKTFDIFYILLNVLMIYENKKINQNPQKLLPIENDIFKLIESFIKKSTSSEILLLLYQYVFQYCKYEYINPHSYALYKRSIETIKSLFLNKNFKYDNIFTSFIDSVKQFILTRNQNEVIESLIKFNKNNQNKNKQLLFEEIIFEFINIISSILDEITNESIWLKIIECFESIFKQSFIGFCSVQRIYQQDIIKSSIDIEMQIINFNVNQLIPKSISLSELIQTKLLNLLDLGCNLEYTSFNNNLFEIRKICIFNLFDICQYHSISEIKQLHSQKYDEKNIDNFVNIKIKIAKMCTPILIKRLEGLLKKFLEDEIKSGDMPLSRNRINEMKDILEKIKNLDLYPDFITYNKNNFTNNNNTEQKSLDNITFIDVISKSKKIHLFFLQPILSDFILTKEKEIKVLIRDIFQEISKCIGLSEISFFK